MKKDSRPNILLITTDQQRFDTINAAGYSYAITPSLDALAADGIIYRNAYSPNPACIPARHNILTGLTARFHTFSKNYFNNETQIPEGIPTFPRILSDAGYDTAAVGKMHFSPARRSNGFNHLLTMEEIPYYLEDDDYLQYLGNENIPVLSPHGVRHCLYMRPQESIVPERNHGSRWVADRSIEYIKTNHGTRPFMLWSSFIEPHPPFDVPPEYARLYDNVPLPRPYSSITETSVNAEECRAIIEDMTEEEIRRSRELYYAAITYADSQIGRIIGALKEEGLYDNTLIIFTSDHGEMLGDNGTWQKFQAYEGSCHVPFIMKPSSGMNAAVRDDEFVDLNDLFPTFLDAAGIAYTYPSPLPGESLFSEGRKKNREEQIVEYNTSSGRWVMVRDRVFKFVYYYASGRMELFNLEDDPKERKNLLAGGTDVYRDRISFYMDKLVEYEKKFGEEKMVDNDRLRVLPPREPFLYKERNAPVFITRLKDEEKKRYMSYIDEFREAVKNEKTVNLDALPLDEIPSYE